jgi:hypothetical protein
LEKGMDSGTSVAEHTALDGRTFKSICKLRGIKVEIRRSKDERMGNDTYRAVIYGLKEKPQYVYEVFDTPQEAKRHAYTHLYLLIARGE